MAARRHPDLPEVELLSAGHVDRSPETALGPQSRVAKSTVEHSIIGQDRVGDLLSRLQDFREKRQDAELSVRGSKNSSVATVFQKRTAQVMQGTLVDLPAVLYIITEPAFWSGAQGLRVDASTARTDAREVVLEGKLRMPPGLWRNVQLRLYPTPSENLTVLELLPLRRWMPQTRRYLRSGVPAISALTDRIEAEARTRALPERPPSG